MVFTKFYENESDRFKVTAFGNKTKTYNSTFDLEGSKIPYDEDVKLFGETIDFKLYFNKHISQISKKASKQLNILYVLANISNNLLKTHGPTTTVSRHITVGLQFCRFFWMNGKHSTCCFSSLHFTAVFNFLESTCT